MKSQFISLVVIFFILINTDLSEAKGGRGGRRFRVSSRGSGAGYSGGGGGGK